MVSQSDAVGIGSRESLKEWVRGMRENEHPGYGPGTAISPYFRDGPWMRFCYWHTSPIRSVIALAIYLHPEHTPWEMYKQVKNAHILYGVWPALRNPRRWRKHP